MFSFPWSQERLLSLESANNSLSSLQDQIISGLKGFCIEDVAVCTIDRRRTSVLTSSAEHLSQLICRNGQSLLAACRKEAGTFLWRPEMIIGAGTENEYDILVATPFRFGPSQIAAVTFAGSNSEWRQSDVQQIAHIAIHYFNQFTSVLEAASTKEFGVLTSREREALRWGAQGKTSHDIALILGTTQRTINQHFANASRKLGTANRVQTVVTALQYGFL